MSHLHLEDLECDIIKGIHSITHLSPFHLTLKNVSITQFQEVPCITFLKLTDLQDNQDLEDFSTFRDGEAFTIRGHSSFDNKLMGLFEVEISPPYHIAPSLHELHTQDCKNFMEVVLRKMVKVRRDFAMHEENKHLGFACISVGLFLFWLQPAGVTTMLERRF